MKALLDNITALLIGLCVSIVLLMIYRFCKFCCCPPDEDSEVPIHSANILLTSSRHTSPRRAGNFHTQRTGEQERPIGFTHPAFNGTSGTSQNALPSAPVPSCPVEDFPSERDTNAQNTL
uniref:Uncharacterized protein n=1 Tax=Phlebotomus papatasi TaxID=29031 RepID=A0A1B0D2K2_PHLPP